MPESFDVNLLFLLVHLVVDVERIVKQPSVLALDRNSKSRKVSKEVHMIEEGVSKSLRHRLMLGLSMRHDGVKVF